VLLSLEFKPFGLIKIMRSWGARWAGELAAETGGGRDQKTLETERYWPVFSPQFLTGSPFAPISAIRYL
jgi:hypothetical protein